MADDKSPSRQPAASVSVPFSPSEAVITIKEFRPFLTRLFCDNTRLPSKWLTDKTCKKVVANTIGDVVRGQKHLGTLRPIFDEDDGAIKLVRGFAERIEPRRAEGEWSNLVAKLDRLLRLQLFLRHDSTADKPSNDESHPDRDFERSDSTRPWMNMVSVTEYHKDFYANANADCIRPPAPRFWRVALVNIATLDPTLLDDMEEAALELKRLASDEASGPQVTPPKVRREEHPYRFECGPEIVRVVGLGEDVALEKTEGVERLIAIVTNRRVSVMKLARIGSPQHGRCRYSLDVDADRLSERESVNDERFESRMGDDAPSAVREAVGELIARRDAAAARGDDDEADKLSVQITATLEAAKTDIQAAAGTVRKSLERTYERLRKGDHGIALAKHFDQFVTRPRNEPDYVYSPDESHAKIVWSVK